MIMMQIVGSLYMFYLAYQLYKTDKSEPATNQSGTFLSGFAMQFLNLKVLLFTLTVIPTFVMPYYNEVSAGVLFISKIGHAGGQSRNARRSFVNKCKRNNKNADGDKHIRGDGS